MTQGEAAPTYQLWSGNRGSWCEHELEDVQIRAVQALFPKDWDGNYLQLDFDFELVPDPNGPQGPWSLAARARGMTVGYVSDPEQWAGPIRRIIASGCIPMTNGNIWAHENPWNETTLQCTPRLNLGSFVDAYPLNDPPQHPYTLLPRGSIIQVTKEDQHFDALLKYVPPSGRGLLILTLHENSEVRANAKPFVEIRINDEKVGQLTPQMSQRFLPMIRHFASRGLITAARGDIEGSQVAAEVRVESIKANEADDYCLNGPPVTVTKLVARQSDPLAYDLSRMSRHLQSVAAPPPRPMPPEPPDGSLVRFSSSRYVYLAIHHGPLWETTATGDWGTFRETMTWSEIASRIRSFEIPTGWDKLQGRNDPRVRENGCVIYFYAGGQPMAALCVGGEQSASWYGTMTSEMEDRLPFHKHADWSDIAAYGQNHHLAVGWTKYPQS